MLTRNKVGMLVAEFLGTALLTSTVLAEANSNIIVNKTWFVAATAGLTLTLIVLLFSRVSGAHVNPAITIGLWTHRKIETTTAIAYIAAQMLGAGVAWQLFQYLQNDVLQNTAGNFDWRIFWAEVAGTFIFGLGVAAVVQQRYEGYRAAFTIGTSLMFGILVAATASNGILNPAVAFGVSSWSWIYGAAPILGSVIGMNVYDVCFSPSTERRSSIVPTGLITKSAKKSKK